MADTQTTNLNLTKPEPGAAEDTWGISLNADLDTLDAIFSSSGTQVNLNPNQINFAQNKKAIFGTNSDLQIYHDGNHSYIEDSGSGNLRILVGDMQIRNYGTNENVITSTANAEVTLYHNASPKLATTSTGIDVTGTVTSDGVSVDGNINLGDNDSIYLGDSNDLRIYHDSGSSLIRNTTGSLYIQDDDGHVYIRPKSGQDGLVAIADGAVTLHHSGNAKLATTSTGIDVTGTVVSDGLTVDGSATFNLGAGEEVGIYRSTDYAVLRIGASSTDHWSFQEAGTNSLYISSKDSGTAVTHLRLDNNGDISFYNTAGNSQALFWDASAEKLGLGTTSPSLRLHSKDTGSYQLDLDSGGTRWRMGAGWSGFHQNKFLLADTASGIRMVVDTSGNVGIGTDTPSGKLSIKGTTASNDQSHITFENTQGSKVFAIGGGADGVTNNNLFFRNVTDNTTPMVITDAGNVGINTNSPSEKLEIENNASVNMKLNNTGQNISLEIGAQASAARITAGSGDRLGLGAGNTPDILNIDASENVLVGKTSDVFNNEGISLRGSPSGSGVTFTRNNNNVAAFNRLNSDGSVLTFNKDGTTVGSVSVTGSATTYNTSSDARLKDVTGEARGLEVINELNPVAYNWKADGKADEGLIAQEVQEIVPNAVSGSEEDMYQMDYSKLVVHLVKAVKEQQTQIESLKGEIANLKGE